MTARASVRWLQALGLAVMILGCVQFAFAAKGEECHIRSSVLHDPPFVYCTEEICEGETGLCQLVNGQTIPGIPDPNGWSYCSCTEIAQTGRCVLAGKVYWSPTPAPGGWVVAFACMNDCGTGGTCSAPVGGAPSPTCGACPP